MCFDFVRGLKIEDELEITNSDKSGNGSEIANSVEQFDSNESNHMEVKRTRRQPNKRQQADRKG